MSSVAPAVSARPWYRYYVLALLLLAYVINVVDRTPVLGVALQSIKREFGATDTELGLLSGLAFAVFYSTMGIPIAAYADRGNRRNVLALSALVWSLATACCGVASSFAWLFVARVGTAVGEAGGAPPSHSLISDYFPMRERGRAFAILALGVGAGTMIGNLAAGRAIAEYGWRATFVIVGLPGVLIALVVRLTVIEPPRGTLDGTIGSEEATISLSRAIRSLRRRPAFVHLCFAAALHSVAWYASGAFNATFLQRSHAMTAGVAANWIALFALAGTVGTFVGGYAADWMSVRRGDERWYFWLPGAATIAMVPFQTAAYLTDRFSSAIVPFLVMSLLAAAFFGPSFAMAQRLARARERSVATSLLFFVQTVIGYGIGPLLAGFLSDHFAASAGGNSLRYALTLVGLVNIWAAAHYAFAARAFRRSVADVGATR